MEEELVRVDSVDQEGLVSVDPLDQEEARVDTVDDGINMENDDYSYSHWQIIKYSVLTYLSNPWVLLILLFLLYKIYGRIKLTYIDPLFNRFSGWRERMKMEEEAALIKKHPDQYISKMEEMERARARLQEQYERSTSEWREKQLAQEERKRQQEIDDWEDHLQGKGYKSRAKTGVDREREALEQQARVKGKKGFRPESNPLMGMGGGSGYRPSRRVTGGGG